MKEDRFFTAFTKIAWYNGHYKWLCKLVEELKNSLNERYPYTNPFRPDEWNKEPHVLYMMLVSTFGDWGTSINSGWIDKKKECINFLEQVLKDIEERL